MTIVPVVNRLDEDDDPLQKALRDAYEAGKRGLHSTPTAADLDAWDEDRMRGEGT